MIETFTVGFTKKSAQVFFTKLRDAGAKQLIDVRLNNSSQLAGFAKRDDLKFFLKELADIEYLHVPDLAATKDILDAYKKHGGDWAVYEDAFLELMAKRAIETNLTEEMFDRSCLLCSEHLPEHCHRRLVIEYLDKHWGDMSVTHIT